MKTLIVIDMQKDFINGALGTKEAQAIVPAVIAKIAAAKAAGDNVIFTRDTHGPNYLDTIEGKNLPVPHCIAGTDGWKIPSEIDDPACVHVDKLNFGFHGWDNFRLYPLFENIDEIELIGLCTDICVVSNALILKSVFPEIPISVDAACCAGVTPESHAAAIATMRMCQIQIKE